MEKEKFDLENFPISDNAKKMLSYVTDGFYDNSYVGKWLYQVMGIEYDKAQEIVETLPDQFFPETATWGLSYHEIKWGLPVCEHLSYEERRRLIYLKRDFRAPMTPYRIEQYLSDAIGFEVKIADVNDSGDYGFIAPHPNVFKAYFIGEGTLNAKKARELLNQLKQSHTTYCMEERIEIQLDNQQLEQIILQNIQYHMRLPFWGEDLYDGTYLFDGAILYHAKKRYGLALGFWHHTGRITSRGKIEMVAAANRAKLYTEERTKTRVQLHVGFSFWDLSGVYDGSGYFDGTELFDSVRRYALAVRSLLRLTIAEQPQDTRATLIASAGAARSRESAEAGMIGNRLGCLALVGWRGRARLAVCAGVLSEQETIEHLTVETRTSDCQFYDGAVLFDGTQKKWNSIFRKEVIE